jgi:hypothetical protein
MTEDTRLTAPLKRSRISGSTYFREGQANAACAWILWKKVIVSSNGNNKPLETAWDPKAFDTHKECEVARSNWLTRKPESGVTIKQMSDDIISLESKDNKSILSAKCLPDTINPNQ